MSFEDAFLHAICDRPDDDTPRLVYADWPDEHGDAATAAVATFIRGQLRLAAVPYPRTKDEIDLVCPPGELIPASITTRWFLSSWRTAAVA